MSFNSRLFIRKSNEILSRFIYALFALTIHHQSMSGSRNIITSVSPENREFVHILLMLNLIGASALIFDSIVSFIKLYVFSRSSGAVDAYDIYSPSKSLDRVCFYVSRYRHYIFFLPVVANLGFLSIGYSTIRDLSNPGKFTNYPLMSFCFIVVISGLLLAFLDAALDNQYKWLYDTTRKKNKGMVKKDH